MDKKKLKYYVKKSGFAVMYLFITIVTGLTGLAFSNDLLIIKILLGVMNIGLYGFFVVYYNYKTGEEAMSIRFSNDLNRMEIIRTGKDIKLKTTEEYHWWKGFFIGFLSSVPLIALWIIHIILTLITGKQTTIAGGVAIFLYVLVIYFFNIKGEGLASTNSFYLTSLYLPLVIILSGIGYLLGARKAKLRQQGFEELNKEIYGE